MNIIESWISQDFSKTTYTLHVMVRDNGRVCHINLHGFESVGQALQREQAIVDTIQYHQTASKDFLLLEFGK